MLTLALAAVVALGDAAVIPRDCKVKSKYVVAPDPAGRLVADVYENSLDASAALLGMSAAEREAAALVQLVRSTAFREGAPESPEEERPRFAVVYRVSDEAFHARPKPVRFYVRELPPEDLIAVSVTALSHLYDEGLNVGVGTIDADNPRVFVVVESYTPCPNPKIRSARH